MNKHSLPRYPKLSERLISDVAVVGGGMAGILTAYTLKSAGLRVVLLEEGTLASEVTARSTAKLSAQHGFFCERLIRDFGEHLARQYLMAQLHAVRQYRELITGLNIPCSLTEQISHVYSAQNGPDLSREYTAALVLGAPVELRTAPALPFPAQKLLCFTGQASFDPICFLGALLPDLTIFEHSAVRDIRGHTVRCDSGSVEAAHIVVATRYPMLERWGFYHLKLRQEQQCLLSLAGAPHLDGWYLAADPRGFNLQNQGKELILSGRVHRCGENPGNSYEQLRSQAKKWFPAAVETRAWSSQDCVTLDGVPYIGRYSTATPHLHVATGFGRWGMTNSMVSATLLTAEILGNHYPYADIFSPDRFFPSASIESMMEGTLYAIRGKARRLFTVAERETAKIEPGHGGIVRHHEKLYGVYRNENGQLYAVSPVCPHRGCALEWNDEEKTWDCPCHGSRFDYTGRRMYHPARAALNRADIREL